MTRQRSQVHPGQFSSDLEYEKDRAISLLCLLTVQAITLSREIKSLRYGQANRILRGCISRIQRVESLVHQLFNVIPCDNQAKTLRQVNRVYILLQAQQKKLQIQKLTIHQSERRLFLNLKDWGRSLKHTENTIKAQIQQFSDTVIPEYLQDPEEMKLESITFIQSGPPVVKKQKEKAAEKAAEVQKYDGIFSGIFQFCKNLIT